MSGGQADRSDRAPLASLPAVRALAHSEARSHRGALIALVLVVAVVSAGVLTAAAGARRTASVYDRFLDRSQAADVIIGAVDPLLASDPSAVRALAASMAGLDGVMSVQADIGIPLILPTKYDFLLAAPAPGSDSGAPIGRVLLVRGRLPDLTRPDEIVINEPAAEDLGVGPGDTLDAPVLPAQSWVDLLSGTPDAFNDGLALGHRVTLRVVGIVRDESSLSVGSTASPWGRATPAFVAAYPNAGPVNAVMHLRVDSEQFSLADARATADRAISEGAETWYVDDDNRGQVRTAFRWIAVGLAIFAAVGFLAGLLAIVQTVSRQLLLSRESLRVASALGMSRRERGVAVLASTIAASALGILLGTLTAVLLSGRFPVSAARRAEVDAGLKWDGAVHLAAAMGLLSLVVIAAVALAVHQTRSSTKVTPAREPRWLPLRRRLRPPAAYGTSTVLDLPAARRVGVRPWTALAGSIVALAGATAVVVFEANRTQAAGEPARYGWTWDLKPDVSTDDEAALLDRLVADSRLSAVGGVFCETVELRGAFTPQCAFVSARGAFGPTILVGREPASSSEVVLGEETARSLAASVGDSLDLATAAGDQRRFTVTGLAAVPLVSNNDTPGRGMVVTPDGLEALRAGPVREAGERNLVLTVTDGLDVNDVAAQLEAEYAELAFPPGYAFPEPPELVRQLERLRPSLLALAAFLGLLGALGLAHFLALSTRRRRREFGALQAIGFVSGQVRSSVLWQSATVATVGVVVGLPVGFLVGRTVWRAVIDGVGMDDRLGQPFLLLGVIAVVAVVGGVVVAVVPGVLAGRTRPGEALRTE